jgi:hypothetical protein
LAQYDPTAVKTGIPTVLGTDTARADRIAAAGLTTAALATGDACQVSGALTMQKALNTEDSAIVGVYEGTSGSVVREGVVVATMAAGVVLANGDTVYLSATPGALTNVKPTMDMLHEVGVVVDAASSRILLQQKPVIVLPASYFVWVSANVAPLGVAKFLTADGSYVTRYASAAQTGGVLWDGARIWASKYAASGIYRINPDGTLIDELAINSQALQLAFDGTYVWAPSGGNIVKIDAAGAVVGTYAAGGTNFKCICYDGVANVWYTSWSDNSIRKMRCSDGAVVGTYATTIINNTGVTTDGTYVYSAGETGGSAGRVCKFLITTGALSGPYATGGGWGYGVTYDGAGSVWVANTRDSTIGKIDTATGALSGPYGLSPGAWGASGVAFDGTHIWASDANADKVRKFNLDGSVVGDYGDAAKCQQAGMLCTTYRVGLP